MQKSALTIAAAVLLATGPARAQYIPTPTATAVGPWRTGVSVHCPDGRTIPANTAISGPDVTPEQLCGINSSSGPASTGGAVISNTGNFQQDMLTNSVNLLIVSNTKNPFVSSFMQGAASSFISSMFQNNAEADRQRAIMAQQILERQQEAERQRRIAEQQRLDAMFARLSAALKLEGVPLTLSLKTMDSSSPDSLQLKSMNSVGPDGLKLKMNEASPTAYGLKGLPGIYVGGPAGSSDSTSSGAAVASASQNSSGSNPNLVNGPGTGTTGSGIPGLPGIYLDTAQPAQAPQLAQAAQTMTGPERTVAEDTAIHAAEKNSELTGSSPDPKVQSFQQADQDYNKALEADAAAAQQLEETQRHVESDKSAVEVARAQLASITPSVEQQQKFDQMLSAAKTDEEASMLARQNFDSTQITLSASRDRAVSVLSQTAPSTAKISAPANISSPTTASPSASSNAVQLTHASQPVTAQLLRPAVEKGGPIETPPTPKPVSMTKPLEIDACLAVATHSATPPASRPSIEQLREQLGIAKESLARLLETHMRENEEREDWAKEMRKSGVSLGHQAFDLTVKAVLGHYAADAKLESDWAFLYSNKETYERAKDAEERFKSAAEAADKIATLRDTDQVYRDYNDPKRLPGDIVPALDAAKLTVKTLLSREDVRNTLERWAQYGVKAGETVPFVDRTVTIGGGLIDAGYDLTVEYLGFQQIQQADRNSELFYRGAAPLQKKIQTTVDQLKCFQ
jgi:hypothetical protein